MLPYGLNQKVNFKKNFGPELGPLNLEEISNVDEIDFLNKLYPIYRAIKNVRASHLTKNKDLIGFVGAPWTLLVYMINKKSPKNKINLIIFLIDKNLIKGILNKF